MQCTALSLIGKAQLELAVQEFRKYRCQRAVMERNSLGGGAEESYQARVARKRMATAAAEHARAAARSATEHERKAADALKQVRVVQVHISQPRSR